MGFRTRKVRSLVALVTAFWTSLACCCALAAHPQASANLPEPNAEPADACCDSKQTQTPADQPAQPADQPEQCACGKPHRMAAPAEDVQAVTKSSPALLALDWLTVPFATLAPDMAAVESRHLAWTALPQSHCAQSLLAMSCQLTT
jgi:hypothetical protein